MTTDHPAFRWSVIGGLVLAISLLHFHTVGGRLGLHLIHRELYFLPIFLACFWFGLARGLGTAVAVSAIYLPPVLGHAEAHGSPAVVAVQILVFLLAAAVLGALVERERRRQREALAVENLAVLGRAAAVVGFEINGTLTLLRQVAAGMDPGNPRREDTLREIDRLAAMGEVLASFIPREEFAGVVHDLNASIQEQLRRMTPRIRQARVHVRESLDPQGCPSRIQPERFQRLLADLVQNALEVSRPGQTVTVRSERGGDFCRVAVADEGPGIRPEHRARVFTPFFTTKPGGQGLALSSARKVLRDLGGDITLDSATGRGTTVTLVLPRESPEALMPPPRGGS
jgi:signal transduction histidine kinase